MEEETESHVVSSKNVLTSSPRKDQALFITFLLALVTAGL